MDGKNYWTRTYGRRISRRRFLGALAAGSGVVAVGGLAACREQGPSTQPPAGQAETPRPGGTLRISATGSPPTLDPYRTMSFLTRGIAGGVYGNLFMNKGVPSDRYPSLEVEPDIAESYEIADGGTTYIIRLRPNARFHPPLDRPVTAQDVVFSFERFLGRLPGVEPAPNRDQFDMVDSVQATDDRTAVFKLRQPFASFLNRLADDYNAVICPREAGTAFDPARTMVGAGPWMFVENIPGTVTRLRRNPSWHVDPQRPYLDSIEVNVIPEYATTLNQFLAGNLDLLNVQGEDVLRVRDSVSGAQFDFVVNPYIGYLSFANLSGDRTSPWADVRVRRAISMAIDHEAIFNTLYNAPQLRQAGFNIPFRQHNLIPAGCTGYWLDPNGPDINPSVARYFKYDPQGARALLAEAGYPDGFSAPYHYTEIYGAGWKLVAELIPQYLARVGIRLRPIVEDYASVYVVRTFRGEYDGLAFQYQGFVEPGDYLTSMYTPGASRNHSKVNDPDLLRKIQAIQANLNMEDRRRQILQLQNELAEKMYYVPVVYDSGPYWSAAQPWVRGAFTHRTARSGGYTQNYSRIWLNR